MTIKEYLQAHKNENALFRIKHGTAVYTWDSYYADYWLELWGKSDFMNKKVRRVDSRIEGGERVITLNPTKGWDTFG